MEVTCKLIKNKSNGQINISLPKKQLTKAFLKDLDNSINKLHKVRIKI